MKKVLFKLLSMVTAAVIPLAFVFIDVPVLSAATLPVTDASFIATVDDASAGDVFELQENVNITSNFTINKNITIATNGYSITVNNSAVLTFSTGTITGTTTSPVIIASNAGMMINGSASITTSTGAAVVSSGSINMTGGSITSTDSASGVGLILQSGMTSVSGGTITARYGIIMSITTLDLFIETDKCAVGTIYTTDTTLLATVPTTVNAPIGAAKTVFTKNPILAADLNLIIGMGSSVSLQPAVSGNSLIITPTQTGNFQLVFSVSYSGLTNIHMLVPVTVSAVSGNLETTVNSSMDAETWNLLMNQPRKAEAPGIPETGAGSSFLDILLAALAVH